MSGLKECEFVQVRPPTVGSGRLASIELAGTHGTDTTPDVTFSKCCFVGVQDAGSWKGVAQGGQNAVVWTGPASVRMDNCAFGPHADLFSFTKATRPEDARLELQQCSAFLGPESAVFRLDKQASCRLDVTAVYSPGLA